MTGRAIPDGFGRDYRHAVFLRTTTKRALALAWVLLDAAYGRRSLTVELGYRLLEHETGLAGWGLARARDDLAAAGLLSVVSHGEGRAARTHWTLINVRPGADVPGSDERASERALERALERAPTSGHASASASDSPLSPPKGGQEDFQTELKGAVRTNSRRDRRTNAERIADAVARLDAKEKGE